MSAKTKPLRCLITGGSGFLGWHLVRELEHDANSRGHTLCVRVLDLVPPDASLEVEFVEGSATDPEAASRACDGIDVVFHCAAVIAWDDADAPRVEHVNVEGTRTVLEAARAAGVRALVHTSTQDVLWGGTPLVDADETWPYPARPADAYARTKAAAERLALAADGTETPAGHSLRVAVIRPCGMWGERDPYHLDNLIEAIEQGRFTFRVGDGSSRFQHVYVGNVALAHVLAAHDLLGETPKAAGQCYFATDEPAENFFDFLEPIVREIGYDMPPRSKYVPFRLAYAMGAVVETFAASIRPIHRFQPKLTRNSVRVLCTDFTFSGDKIRDELGYAPRHTPEGARRRTVEHYRARKAEAG